MKKLQNNTPYVSTIPEQSNIMSIIHKDNRNWNWFINYFIQLVISKDTEYSLSLNFCYGDNYSLLKTIPILDKYCLPRNMVEMQKNIGEFIRNAIDLGYFVYFSVDEYEIEYYELYQKKHANHDLMVVGYNEDTFYIADFFDTRYSVKNCAVEQMEAGFNNYDEKRDNSGFPEVYLMKAKDNYTYTFNIEFVKILIAEYLGGINSNVHFHPIKDPAILNQDLYVFGMNIYSVLGKYIKNLKDKKVQIRSFHILYEHKRIILELINYLCENNYLRNGDIHIAEMEKILKDTLTLRNCALKYNIASHQRLLQKMLSIIDDIFRGELNLFKALYDDIGTMPKIFINENIVIDSLGKSIVYKGKWEKTLENTMHSSDVTASAGYLFKGNMLIISIKPEKKVRRIQVSCDNIVKEYVLSVNKDKLVLNDIQYGYHYVVINNTDTCDIELLEIECRTEECEASDVYNSCRYDEIDFITKGNWESNYGKGGYDIYNYKKVLYSYTKLVYSGFTDKVWKISDENDKGQVLLCENNRIAACKFFGDKASIDVVIAGRETHTLALYIMDCYNFERNVCITVIDSDSLEVLDVRTVNVINMGIYVKYIIKGHLTFELHNCGKAIGVVSAVFID